MYLVDEVSQGDWHPPYLLILESDKALREADPEYRLRDGRGTSDSLRSEVNAMIRVRRFFEVMQGLYNGSLDLTGRHPQRFLSYLIRWNLYISDFMNLLPHVEGYKTDEFSEQGVPYIDFRVNDITVWETFQKNWKIPSCWNYGMLFTYTASTVQEMVRHPHPILQKLCLLHLPPEILDYVFLSMDDLSARKFASTCKHLNDIGRRHVFRTRWLSFTQPDGYWRNMKMEYLLALARSSLDEVLSKCSFFLACEEILDRLKNLTLSDGWRFNQEGQDVQLDNRFYQPLYRAFNDVLGAAANLTYLKLHKVRIDLDLVRSISSLCRLHTVDLFICHIDLEVQGALLSTEFTTLWTSVYNLHLLFLLGTDDDTLWYSFLLCPELRTFSAYRPGPNHRDELPQPPRAIWGRGSSFATLERLSISGICFEDNIGVLAWLILSPDTTRLTHFKMSSGRGLADGGVLAILAAIRPALLQVLVIDGLAHADPALLTRISSYFPGLLGLTLVRRAGTRQLVRRPVIWPHPRSEYARSMGGFTQLQHFYWNFPDDLPSPTTAPLLRFEEDFVDSGDDIVGWKSADDQENLDDAKWTPMLFALYCPNLQTYMDDHFDPEWRIARSDSQAISAERSSGGSRSFESRKWDTDMEDQWPDILPEGSDRG